MLSSGWSHLFFDPPSKLMEGTFELPFIMNVLRVISKPDSRESLQRVRLNGRVVKSSLIFGQCAKKEKRLTIILKYKGRLQHSSIIE